jgi:hypothetical protein
MYVNINEEEHGAAGDGDNETLLLLMTEQQVM